MFTSLLSSLFLALLGSSSDDVLELALTPQAQPAAYTSCDDEIVVTGHPILVEDESRVVIGHPLKAQSVPRVVTGYPVAVQSEPRVVTGHPVAVQSVPRVVTGYPVAVQSEPRVVTGHPVAVQSVPRVVTGYPVEVQTAPRVVMGHPVKVQNMPRVVMGHQVAIGQALNVQDQGGIASGVAAQGQKVGGIARVKALGQVAPIVVQNTQRDDDKRVVRRIGVTTRRVDESIAYHLGVDADDVLMIASTQDGMPAEESGLTTYDVIVSVDGVPPTSSDVLREAVQSGDDVVLVVRRGAETRELRVPVREVVIEEIADGFPYGGIRQLRSLDGTAERLEAVEKLLAEVSKVDPGSLDRSVGLADALSAVESARANAAEAQRFKEYAEKLAGQQSVEIDAARELDLARFLGSARSATAARQRAELEAVEAELARKQADVEARRAEIEVLRGSLAGLGDAEAEKRAALEVELSKLRAASADLSNKQSLLELKAGEALIRDGSGRLELVLPSDLAKGGVIIGGQSGGSDLDAVHDRLDELTKITREILALLTSRSAR